MAKRKQPVPAPEPTADAQHDGVRCPVCGLAWEEGICDHLVSTWDFADEGGQWAGGANPDDLRGVVTRIVEAFEAGFTGPQLRALDALLGLPPELLAAVTVSIRDGDFASGEWTDYVGSVTTQGSTFAGSAWCESHSPGASCAWTSYWARNPKAWAKRVDGILSKALRALRRVERVADRLPRVGE